MAEAEVLIAGTGVSGTAAALAASETGTSLTWIEKRNVFGGSAALSAGMFWTAPTLEALRGRVPRGDDGVAQRLIDDYDARLDDIRALGVHVAPEPTLGISGFGRGYSIDIRDLLERGRRTVVERGGRLTGGTGLVGVRRSGDRLAVALERPSRTEEIEVDAVVLATGGFQGDRARLRATLGPDADKLLLRANPGSTGDGIRIATGLGAGTTPGLDTYYGHLVPSPLTRFDEADFLPFAQYYSVSAIVIDQGGERFVDETIADEITNQALARRDGSFGVLIFDDTVRQRAALSEPFPGFGILDRVDAAIQAGAAHASAPTLEALIEQIAEWGVDRQRALATLREHADAVARGGDAEQLVSNRARTPSSPPFFAIAVQPAITFTLGGVRIDARARALDEGGAPIRGLFVCGADIGGYSNHGYAGGLAPGFITGHWAGRGAADHARAAVGG